MTSLVKVLSTAVKEAYRLIKINRYGGDKDILTPDEAMPHGLDSNPVKDMLAVYAETGIKGQAVIVGYLQKNRLAEPGEFRTYATDANGQQVFYTWMKADGTMEIGGTADNMVRYSKLETAYNQLKSDHDGVVNDNNNLKIALAALASALTAAGATPLTGTSLGTIVSTALSSYYGSPLLPSTGDITPAKINEIKTT